MRNPVHRRVSLRPSFRAKRRISPESQTMCSRFSRLSDGSPTRFNPARTAPLRKSPPNIAMITMATSIVFSETVRATLTSLRFPIDKEAIHGPNTKPFKTCGRADCYRAISSRIREVRDPRDKNQLSCLGPPQCRRPTNSCQF